MADKPQPDDPSQDKADKTSRPTTGSDSESDSDSQSLHTCNEANYASDDDDKNDDDKNDNDKNDNVSHADPVVNEIMQRLSEETAGHFDFDIDDASTSPIQTEDDFRRALRAYEHTNDISLPVDDFPTDPAIRKEYVRKIAKALVNLVGAVDLKNEKGNDSAPVNRIKKLRKTEIELISNIVLYGSRDGHGGQSRRIWGEDSPLRPENFESWEARLQAVLDIVKIRKKVVLRLIRDREKFALKLASRPAQVLKETICNEVGNKKKQGEITAGRKKKSESRESSTAQNTPAAAGIAGNQGTHNALEPPRAQDASERQKDAAPSSSATTKQKRSSAVPTTPAQGSVNMPPAPAFSRNGPNASLATQGGVKTSTASSSHGTPKQSGQRTRPGPGDIGPRNVPQPASGGRTVPPVLVLHGVPPRREGVVPARAGASSTGPRLPTQENAGLRASTANMDRNFGAAPKASPNSSGESSGQKPQPKPKPRPANKSAVQVEYRPANRQPPSPESAADASPENGQPTGHRPRAPGAGPPVSEREMSAAQALLQLRYSGGRQSAGGSNNEGASSGNPGARPETRKQASEASPSVDDRRPRIPLHVAVAFQQKKLDFWNSRAGQGSRASEHEGEERASKKQKRKKREDEDPKRPREASPSVDDRRSPTRHEIVAAWIQRRKLDLHNSRAGQGSRASEDEGEERASKRRKHDKRDDDDAEDEDEE